MNGALGTAGVALGLGACLLGTLTVLTGIVKGRPRLLRGGLVYAGLALAGAVLAVVAMQAALITRDFSLAYVADVGSTRTPALYNVAAMWSSLEGSILLWVLIQAGYLGLVALRFRDRANDPLVGWALVTLFVITGFFFLLLAGPANPFAPVSGPTPADGLGPNPLLQNHVLVLVHPPLLYLGYVGFSVPFAFSVAALATGRIGEGWLLETRRWTLAAWGFLTVGIILGSWWSYEVLGWGGVWGWDPVENASLLPWLTGTAFLHSVLVQERRGMLRVWNLALLTATFGLTILGTFLTRSGVLDSVHAFSESDIGAYLLVFFALVTGVSLALIGWRGDQLRSPGSIDHAVSREAAFLANNVVFALFAFVVLLGTVFPLVIEGLQDRQITVGRPFFDRMAGPIGLCLLTLMALAPLLPWRRTTGETLRDRAFWPAWCGVGALVLAVLLGADGWMSLVAFGLGGFAAGSALRTLGLGFRRQGWSALLGRTGGGMVVHLGVVVIAVALASLQSYQLSGEFTLAPGESAEFAGHTFTYEGTEVVETDARVATKAQVRIDGDAVYEPAQELYRLRGMTVGTPSVKSGLTKDIYLTLEPPAPEADESARIKVLIMPLAVWLWIGGGIMAVGTVLAFFRGEPRRRAVDGPERSTTAEPDEAAPPLVGVSVQDG